MLSPRPFRPSNHFGPRKLIINIVVELNIVAFVGLLSRSTRGDPFKRAGLM